MEKGQTCFTKGEIKEIGNRLIEDDIFLHSIRNTRPWYEKNKVIYSSVISDGTTGPQRIDDLFKKGVLIGDEVKRFFCSRDFESTSDVTTKIAILKGGLFEDNHRNIESISVVATGGAFTDGMNLSEPNAEILLLMLKKFSDEDIDLMGLDSIVVMCKSFKDSEGNRRILYSYRNNAGRWCLGACLKNFNWVTRSGFVYSL